MNIESGGGGSISSVATGTEEQIMTCRALPMLQGSKAGRLGIISSCSVVGVAAVLVLQGRGSKLHRYGENKLANKSIGVACAGLQWSAKLLVRWGRRASA